MRDDKWLAGRLRHLWECHFSDVKQQNRVFVRFGKKAKTRLGSISSLRPAKKGDTYITITGYFKNSKIPLEVVDAVLAHELTHYAHGFFSPHRRLFRFPHKGSVVDKELKKRGLGGILEFQKKWIKKNWQNYLKKI